jgi:hypothetical protein
MFGMSLEMFTIFRLKGRVSLGDLFGTDDSVADADGRLTDSNTHCLVLKK